MTSRVTSSDDRLDEIENEATEWLVLQTAGSMDAFAERSFVAWLERSSQHRRVYEDMRRTWDDLSVLQQNPGALTRYTAPLHRKAQLARPRRRMAAPLAALAAGLLMAIGLAWFWFGNPVMMLSADYSSARGGIRHVQLPDGSQADLGPDSAIRLQFTASERRVELLGGSAFFTAVPQAAADGRPFIVDTVNLSARALGTQFLVESLPARDDVAVAEHDVEVTMKWPGGEQKTVVLSQGQSLRHRAGMPGAEFASGSPQEIAAWRGGNLVFYRMPLGEVVAELNRYRRGRIVILDDDLAARIVSGVVRVNDPDGALRVITDELRVQRTDLVVVALIHK